MFASLRLARRNAELNAMGMGLYGLAGTFVSLIIVVVAMIACRLLAHDLVAPFGVAEIVTLIATTSAYVIYKNVLAKGKKNISER